MKLTISETIGAEIVENTSDSLFKKILPLAGLAAILLLAAALRFTNLDSLGYANHYYAAAVKSMLQSWHNFFFVAAEPGGSVTVDKPPVGLWLQAISAYFLGVNTLGLLLPQLLAGLLSIVVLYHLVQRSFGKVAGLLAALALAITPVVVAIDRNNTIDSTLILTLLLAAWAFIKATETGKLRHLLLGAVLVGVAFNIKMLAAYLPVPAFFALYFLGAREKIWTKIGKLTLAGLLMLAVSLSWAAAVDLTPAEQRPYIGSSSDNSVLTLIVGYNGIDRLIGMGGGGRPALAGANPGTGGPGSGPNGMAAAPGGNPPPAGFRPNDDAQNPSGAPGAGRFQGGPGQMAPDGQNTAANGNRPRGQGGPFNIGQAGPFRLLTAPLSKEMSWLLPLGLVSMALLALGSRWQSPLSARHQALILWGGWLLIGGVFFSVASFFHEYYLALLGAPLAALVGIGLVELWNLRKTRPLFALLLILVTTGGTIAFQIFTAQSFIASLEWLPLLLGIFLVAALLLIAAAQSHLSRALALAGFTLIVASMFITPAIWSLDTARNASGNQSLPAAYSGTDSAPTRGGDYQVNQKLLTYLQANTQEATYLMAVPSSMQGADYVLATGRPVLYLGGFNGNDAVVTTDKLVQLVQTGELRYIYLSGGNGGQAGLASWVTSTCQPVSGFETTTSNFGAPDGTGAAQNPGAAAPVSRGNGQATTLYDCGEN